MKNEEAEKGVRAMIQPIINFTRRYSHVNWALADQAMVSGSNFVTGILLARTLGITEFGRFTLAWIVVLFVQSIQHAAINAPMMSIGPKQEASEKSAYFGVMFTQQFIFSALSASLVFVGIKASAVFFPSWGVEPLVLPLTAAVFFSQIQDFLRRYYFTIKNPAKSFISDFIRYIGQIAVLFILLFSMQQAITTAIAIWVMVGTSSTAILLILIKLPSISWSAHSWNSVMSRHWRFSKWLIASSLTQWLTGNLFFVMAGAMLGVSVVGALKAAQNLMGLAHILFLGLENIIPMRATRNFVSGGYQALSKYLYHVTLLGTVVTATIALLFSIAPDFWFALLFGEQFVQHSYLVRWYGVLYIIMFLGLPLRFGLRSIEKTQAIFIALLSAAFITIISSYPLISAFGVKGAMAGMIFIQLVMQIILWTAFKNARNIGE